MIGRTPTIAAEKFAQKALYFDHLLGKRKQHVWDGEPQCLEWLSQRAR
jgi:hypothetical protein